MIFDVRLGIRELKLLAHVAESFAGIATGLNRIAAAHEKLAMPTPTTEDPESAAELTKDAEALNAAAQRMREAQGTQTTT